MKNTPSISRFVVSVVMLFALVAASSIAIIKTVPVVGHDYFATFSTKHSRLWSLEGPKLVIVGGSNATFSFASEVLERELEVGVVNMGLHVSLGMQFMLREVHGKIAPGDIVILSPEYEQFVGEYMYGDHVLGELVLRETRALAFMETPSQFLQVLTALPIVTRNAVISNLHPDRVLDPMYLTSGFNKYGDIEISMPAKTGGKLRFPALRPEDLNQEAISSIAEFSRRVRAEGGECFLSYPSVPDTMYRRNAAFFSRLHTALSAERDIIILGTPAEQTHPDSFCYDTHYHLRTKAMRIANTEFIAKRLRNHPSYLVHTRESAAKPISEDPPIIHAGS
ncbi:MAG: hypothetical protein CL946_10855 [Ectothiorhodospiraceae bacterium]|nr:hypothetical protein [Ectothiorhodospiraceae bacterium]